MKLMKIRCIDLDAPRSDFRPGKPQGITLDKVYEVAEILPTTGQYSILNDDFKIARYSMSRFELVETGDAPNLRQGFNPLTTVMRTRIKELERQVEEYQALLAIIPDELKEELNGTCTSNTPSETVKIINKVFNRKRI